MNGEQVRGTESRGGAAQSDRAASLPCGARPPAYGGLLCALPGMSLTMFQKPPSDVRQLPRDAIVAMFELPPRCQGSSFIDNQPMI